jgi:hypothetical protein
VPLLLEALELLDDPELLDELEPEAPEALEPPLDVPDAPAGVPEPLAAVALPDPVPEAPEPLDAVPLADPTLPAAVPLPDPALDAPDPLDVAPLAPAFDCAPPALDAFEAVGLDEVAASSAELEDPPPHAATEDKRMQTAAQRSALRCVTEEPPVRT